LMYLVCFLDLVERFVRIFPPPLRTVAWGKNLSGPVALMCLVGFVGLVLHVGGYAMKVRCNAVDWRL